MRRGERSPFTQTAEPSPPAQAESSVSVIAPSAEQIVALQRSAGNAAVARLLSGGPRATRLVQSRPAAVARQHAPVADPAQAEVMPAPLKVTWAKDPFEISLAAQRSFGDDKLEIIVHYTGPHATTGPFVKDNTKRLTVSVAPKPLAPKLSTGEGSSVDIDLYGDGRKIVRLRSTPSFDSRPSSRGRQHDLDAVEQGRSVFSSSLWVLDPKAGEADIPAPVPEEHPGENPSFSMKLGQKTPELRAEIDGDGDQQKELVVTLTAVENYADPDFKDAVSKLKVNIIQKSTGHERSATFDVPRSAARGSLFPIVTEVTDGKAPTRISLVLPSNTQFLDIWPGTLNDKEARYVVSLGDRAINYLLPPDPKGQKDVGEGIKTQVAGAIIAWDIRLGAHRDEFRVTVRDRGDGKGAFGITALNDGDPTGGGMGAEVKLDGPIRGRLVETGAASVGFDLDGDGKADLQLFDQLTTPSEADGGGPPERQRNHRVRLTGPAVGGDRTFNFQYRHGFLTGGMANPGAADLEADRNAKAVVVMGAQAKQGSFSEQVTLLETAMMPMRKKAADAGVLDMKLYNAWASLSQAMIKIEIASMKGEEIDFIQQISAAGLASGLEDQMNALTTWNDFRAAHMSTYSGNTYTGASQTSLVGGVIAKKGYGYTAADALRAGKWGQALASYRQLVRGLDRWVADRYESAKGVKREDAQEARYMSQLQDQLATMSGKPDVIRPSAVFHPDKKFKDESGYVNAIPLALYCWREGDTWKLKDLTNPAKPYTYSADADPKQSGPPLALFAELDDPDHYPAGLVQFHVPGATAGTVNVRDRLTWKKFFSYLGLGLAAVGLTLATFGTGTVAVAGVWALTASAVSGAVAAGIDLAEHIQHDNLDARTAVMDIAQIVGGLAGAGALAGGRLAMSAASAPAAARFTGAWARTAVVAQRLNVPLTAIAMERTSSRSASSPRAQRASSTRSSRTRI